MFPGFLLSLSPSGVSLILFLPIKLLYFSLSLKYQSVPKGLISNTNSHKEDWWDLSLHSKREDINTRQRQQQVAYVRAPTAKQGFNVSYRLLS